MARGSAGAAQLYWPVAILALAAGRASASTTVSEMTNTYSLNSSECYAPTEEGGWGYCGAPTCRNQYITCADEGGGPPTVDGVTGSYRSDYASDGSDCTSFLDMSDYEEETDWAFKGACTSDCTQRTDGVCDGTFLEQVIQGPSIKYAFCNDGGLVLSSGEGGASSRTSTTCRARPARRPEILFRLEERKTSSSQAAGHVRRRHAYCTGDPTRTVDRYYSLQYPLDVVDFDEGVYTNNVDLFDGSSGSDAIDYAYDDGTGIGTYGLPDGAGVGITVNGMQDWVTQNNRGEWNQPTDSHQCLYGTSNYTSTASHPPIVGFGADGHLIYGRYLGDDAPGFADPLLDECTTMASTSGRRSASSRVLCVSSPVTRFAPRSHYHTQIFGYTCGTEGSQDRCDDGDEVVISTTGPLFCFRGPEPAGGSSAPRSRRPTTI
ncbi:DNA binding protein [Aureococcus anophagefferens]|nr:DNA binding protein [Aureococcus anophagefferens]